MQEMKWAVFYHINKHSLVKLTGKYFTPAENSCYRVSRVSKEATYVDVGSLSDVRYGGVGSPRDTLQNVVVFSEFGLTLGRAHDPDSCCLVVTAA